MTSRWATPWAASSSASRWADAGDPARAAIQRGSRCRNRVIPCAAPRRDRPRPRGGREHRPRAPRAARTARGRPRRRGAPTKPPGAGSDRQAAPRRAPVTPAIGAATSHDQGELRLLVVFESDEDEWVVASCPTLPGCHSQGRTREEALDNIREAIRGYLASMREHDAPLPSSTEFQVVAVPA